MVTVFILIGGFSILFSLFMMLGWIRIPSFTYPEHFNPTQRISVIIPVRNEEKTIGSLLRDLGKQNYPKQLIQVVLIDDHSEDGTLQVIAETVKELEIDFTVQTSRGIGKKEAIETGIRVASGELIVTTDGDCRVGPNWLKSMAGLVEEKEAVFVAGPVRYSNSPNSLHKALMMEFSALQGTGAVTLTLGIPTMCNGANMVYRKSVFEAVGGFEGNKHIASGDDEFLMHRISGKFPDQVYFLKSPEAIVETKPNSSTSDWVNQRMRWASKWPAYEIYSPRLIALVIFLFNLNIFFGLILFLVGEVPVLYFLSIFILKTMADYLFIYSVSRFMGRGSNPLIFGIVELVYPLYVISFGILGIFGNYTWKGRNSKSNL